MYFFLSYSDDYISSWVVLFFSLRLLNDEVDKACVCMYVWNGWLDLNRIQWVKIYYHWHRIGPAKFAVIFFLFEIFQEICFFFFSFGCYSTKVSRVSRSDLTQLSEIFQVFRSLDIFRSFYHEIFGTREFACENDTFSRSLHVCLQKFLINALLNIQNLAVIGW